MKKTALSYVASAALLGSSLVFAGGHAKSVKLGVVLGFTGPAESLAESMARGRAGDEGSVRVQASTRQRDGQSRTRRLNMRGRLSCCSR